MKDAAFWIKSLGLEKHPEGGWFKEVYRSEDVFSGTEFQGRFPGGRNCSTSIYYLLETDDFSSFHRIRSDEVWHYYAGSSGVEVLSIENGDLVVQKLGNNPEAGESFQVVVPGNTWFAARLTDNSGFAFTGCTVSPGFHFDDFEIAGKQLVQEFPHLKAEIEKLIRL